MLTGNLVRVRHAKTRLNPTYLPENDPHWQDVAGQLIDVYRQSVGTTREEIEEELEEITAGGPTQIVHQGFAKLLEDRCEFDTESKVPPEELREAVFGLATSRRVAGAFDRQGILEAVAAERGISVEEVEQGLFADLKAEQRMIQFKDITPEQLVQRYNVALAQAILIRATGVEVDISGESPARYRQLFRAIKFHRLICEITSTGRDAYRLRLDGPLSLFSATQKYGVQLANFLPSLLQCKQFELRARVRWGAQRVEKQFVLDSSARLKSHLPDYGSYVPKELSLFAESFRKQIDTWDIVDGAEIVPLPGGVWLPDFVLTHRKKGTKVYLEVLGFWRRVDAEKLFRRLEKDLKQPFILAVSEQMNTDEAGTVGINSNVYVFKRTPLPEEVARLADAQL